MKRLIFLLLFLSLLVSSAVAEETGVVIDRTANLTEEYLSFTRETATCSPWAGTARSPCESSSAVT